MRVAILTVPEGDHEAAYVVRQRLRQAIADLYVVVEQSADSQRNWIEDILCRWSDEEEIDLIITIGATLPAPGLSRAEIVPEATLGVAERLLPGLPEAMRAYAQAETDLALLDRGVAAIRSRTLILNLPASAAAALLFLEAVVDLLPVVVAHLQLSPTAPLIGDDLIVAYDDDGGSGDEETSISRAAGGLDREEFAAFLARKDKPDNASA